MLRIYLMKDSSTIDYVLNHKGEIIAKFDKEKKAIDLNLLRPYIGQQAKIYKLNENNKNRSIDSLVIIKDIKIEDNFLTIFFDNDIGGKG